MFGVCERWFPYNLTPFHAPHSPYHIKTRKSSRRYTLESAPLSRKASSARPAPEALRDFSLTHSQSLPTGKFTRSCSDVRTHGFAASPGASPQASPPASPTASPAMSPAASPEFGSSTPTTPPGHHPLPPAHDGRRSPVKWPPRPQEKGTKAQIASHKPFFLDCICHANPHFVMERVTQMSLSSRTGRPYSNFLKGVSPNFPFLRGTSRPAQPRRQHGRSPAQPRRQHGRSPAQHQPRTAWHGLFRHAALA